MLKNTENKNPRVAKTKSRRIMLSSNCLVCGSKKSGFIKEQETKALSICINQQDEKNSYNIK